MFRSRAAPALRRSDSNRAKRGAALTCALARERERSTHGAPGHANPTSASYAESFPPRNPSCRICAVDGPVRLEDVELLVVVPMNQKSQALVRQFLQELRLLHDGTDSSVEADATDLVHQSRIPLATRTPSCSSPSACWPWNSPCLSRGCGDTPGVNPAIAVTIKALAVAKFKQPLCLGNSHQLSDLRAHVGLTSSRRPQQSRPAATRSARARDSAPPKSPFVTPGSPLVPSRNILHDSSSDDTCCSD